MNRTIAILLCTYNGEKYLEEQLLSIQKQILPYFKIDIWASDDGSSDSTIDILLQFKKNWSRGKFYILHGPQRGFGNNFWSLIANKAIIADYYALCDQDDIWKKNKLLQAIKILQAYSSPCLYCGRTSLINAKGTILNKKSPSIRKQPCFRNAITQNIASGNTFVFNKSASEYLMNFSINDVKIHDWLIYLLLSASNINIYFDDMPYVLYRQHSGNVIGVHFGLYSIFSAFFNLFSNDIRKYNISTFSILKRNIRLLRAETAVRFTNIYFSKKNYFKKLILFLLIRPFRQRFLGNCSLWFFIFTNRF